MCPFRCGARRKAITLFLNQCSDCLDVSRLGNQVSSLFSALVTGIPGVEVILARFAEFDFISFG